MAGPIATELANWEAMKARLLAQMPELADDEQTLLDTLEGETGLHERLAELIRSAKQDESDADGTNTQMQRLKDRKSALELRADRKKRTVLHFMELAGIPRLNAPDMTVTIKAVPRGVIVTSVDELPDSYCRTKREANKKAIKVALEKNETVPGAELSNGGTTLSIRI